MTKLYSTHLINHIFSLHLHSFHLSKQSNDSSFIANKNNIKTIFRISQTNYETLYGGYFNFFSLALKPK